MRWQRRIVTNLIGLVAVSGAVHVSVGEFVAGEASKIVRDLVRPERANVWLAPTGASRMAIK